MSFDPKVAVAAFLATLNTSAEREKFRTQWEKNVNDRAAKWTDTRQGHQSLRQDQLKWEANVVEYVNYITASKAAVSTSRSKVGTYQLPPSVPLWGPVFYPPTFDDIAKRYPGTLRDKQTTRLQITPNTAYLRPLTVVHPYYFKSLRRCPRDATHSVVNDGWQSNGSREVHGLYREESAIGFQIRCNSCKGQVDENGRSLTYCFSLVNSEYWSELKCDYRQVPRNIPYFFHRTAVTRDLFDLIVELRPSMSASGIATHIEQLHLLEYHSKRHEYLRFIEELTVGEKGQVTLCFNQSISVQPFSPPLDPDGYSDSSISNDMITEVYLHFGSFRLMESEKYLRTLEAITLSFDHTFRITRKAMLVNRDGEREQVWKGGMFSAVNERNEIVLYRFCQSGANDEFGESLAGLRRRFELLDIPLDLIVVADNCCQVAGAVQKNLPGSFLGLDLKHFKGRYEAVIVGGVHNAHRGAVLHDIVKSILERPAENGNPAVWRVKEEQERRLEATYQKWLAHGDVWSAAAAKAHAVQMAHVRKGCLSRPRNDVRSDGSRIEGSHKGWNSLQRANASGYEGIVTLSGDHVLRRNVRVILNSNEFPPTPFLASTFRSHHISLVDSFARQWNNLLDRHDPLKAAINVPHLSNHETLHALPVLLDVPSGETFGAVASQHALTFGGLWKIEDSGEDLLDLTTLEDTKREEFLKELNVDPVSANTYEKKVYVPIDPALLDDPTGTQTSAIGTVTHVTRDIKTEQIEQATALLAARSATVTEEQTCSQHERDPERSIDLTHDSDNASESSASETARLPRQDVPALGAPHDPEMGMAGKMSRAMVEGSIHAVAVAGGQPSSSGMSPDPRHTKRKVDEEEVQITGEGFSAKKPRIIVSGSNSSQTSGQAAKMHRFFSMHQSATRTSPQAASLPPPSTSSIPHTSDSKAKVKEAPAMMSFTPVSTQFGHVKPIGMTSTKLATPTALSTAEPPQTQSGERAKLATVLAQPLPIPSDSRALTRSERLFKAHTGIHPMSLKIDGNDEYFLFMNLRAQHRWASYLMTSGMYVETTKIYNQALEEPYHNKPGPRPIPKSPRAIMEELGRTETIVLARLAKKDFVSRGTGTTTFWTRHCHAVNLVTASANTEKTKTRPNPICTRCHTVMYPGPEGSSSNHKRGICSDGVPTHMNKLKYEGQKTSPDQSPPWPQPTGIFVKEKKTHRFFPFEFLKVLRYMYEKVVVQNDAGALGMEYNAFVDMLQERIDCVDGNVLFKLYPQLELPPTTPESLVEEKNGHRYLRVDCLRDSD